MQEKTMSINIRKTDETKRAHARVRRRQVREESADNVFHESSCVERRVDHIARVEQDARGTAKRRTDGPTDHVVGTATSHLGKTSGRACVCVCV